MILHFV